MDTKRAMSNGGEALDAPQILRLVAESAPSARDRITVELKALDIRRADLVRQRDALDDLYRVAQPMIPNPGSMEGET